MTEDQQGKDGHHRIAKSLQKKAELTRHFHSEEARRLKARIDAISISTVVVSLFIAIVALSGSNTPFLENREDTFYAQVIAVSGFSVLVLSIWLRLRGYEHSWSAHRSAVIQITDFIRLAHKVRRVDLDGCGQLEASQIIERLRQSYSQLTHSLPELNMSNERFLRSKKTLLLKIEASSLLDEDPGADIDSYLRSIRKLERRR